jgi:formate hydrogenlyase subunit 3/multisubunit Na+/H+ antiporter MnhD subunit
MSGRIKSIIILLFGIILSAIFTYAFIAWERWNEGAVSVGLAAFVLICAGLCFYFLFKGRKDRLKNIKEYEIEEKDERNIALRGKVYEVVVAVQMALMGLLFLIFLIATVRIETADNETVLWTLAGLMIAGVISMFAAWAYFNRKM